MYLNATEGKILLKKLNETLDYQQIFEIWKIDMNQTISLINYIYENIQNFFTIPTLTKIFNEGGGLFTARTVNGIF